MNSEAVRASLVKEAQSWLGTPFHHEACLKGSGVDCGNLLKAVFSASGLPAPATLPHYPRDFMLHSSKEWFVEIVLQFASELPEGSSPEPADVIVFRHGRTYSHGAIVIAWPEIIHADFDARAVIRSNAALEPFLPKKRRLFRHAALRATA